MWNKSVVLFLFGLIFSGKADHWGYPDHENSKDNPEEPKWGGMCDNGKRQSPINLNTSIAFHGDFPELQFQNYGEIFEGAVIRNTGHSVQINVPKNQHYKISGGGLPGTYIMEQMHWHWWSEHTINGRRYPLELHLVHRNIEYPNITSAVGNRGGIAVLAVLFHVTHEKSYPLSKVQQQLDAIDDKVGDETHLPKGIKPEEFLPTRLNHYFRYEGSLTTPSCDESVVWTVFIDTLPLTLDQVEKFTLIKNAEGKFLKNNFRGIQPLFNRAVILVSDIEEISKLQVLNKASAEKLSFSILTIVSMMAFYLS